MKTYLAYLARLLILWVPFSLAALASIFMVPIIMWKDWPRGRNILLDLDRAAAGVLGWSGKYTVSAQMGASQNCRVCKAICWFIGLFDPGHCLVCAQDEGLIPRG